MVTRIFIVVVLSLLFRFTSGQCIVRDSLRNQLNYFKRVSSIPSSQKLTTLLNYSERTRLCPYPYDSTYCDLLVSIGELYHKKADYLKAIQYYKQAIGFIYSNKNSPLIQPKDLVKYYNMLFDSNDSLNNTSEKIAALDSAIAVGIRLKSVTRLCLWSLYYKILYFFDIGDYYRCSETAIMCEKLGKEYAASAAEKEAPGGLIYASVSLHWNVNALLALSRYDDAEKLLLEKIKEDQKTHNQNRLGTLYEQLAEVFAFEKQYKKSLFYFQEAFNKEQANGNTIVGWTILNNIGYFIYYLNYNLDSALYYYRKALAIKNKDASQDKLYALESLNTLNSIADVFVRKGLFDSAFRYYQLAFDQIKPGANEDLVFKISQDELNGFGKIRYLTNLFISTGTAYHQYYRATGDVKALQKAIHIYKLTDGLLDRIKAGQVETESKLFWRGDIRRLYEQAIQASFSNNNIAEAFYFFEKSRAVILNDQLNEQRWVGEADISKQTQMKLKIKLLQDEVATNTISPERRKELENDLFNSKQELDALIEGIRFKNPLYYQNFIDSTRITIEDVKSRILTSHQAFIEIYAGDSAIYELILLKGKNYFKTINKAEFDSLSRLYLVYISDPVVNNSHFNDFVRVSSQLFFLFFGNISIPAGRMIISPDGRYFPFESLITSSKNGKIKYFLQDHSVTYTYSARYMLNNFGNDVNVANKKFIGFAPVEFHDRSLVDLAGSDVSLERLQSYFGGERLVKENASRANFLQQFYSYQIIQLYTHASDNGPNGEPIIWFADSTLSLSDLVYEHRPSTKLIVLSACETGSGKIYKGEGIFNFNRGFAALGIPSSISSLWSVDNKSSYRITELFYKHLAEGQPIDIALQKAKVDFISSEDQGRQMPYYWAASIFVGMDESFITPKRVGWKSSLLIISIVGVVILLFFVFYRQFVRRGQRIQKTL